MHSSHAPRKRLACAARKDVIPCFLESLMSFRSTIAPVHNDQTRGIANSDVHRSPLRCSGRLHLALIRKLWQTYPGQKRLIHLLTLILTAGLLSTAASSRAAIGSRCDEPVTGRGIYFEKKEYVHAPLPRYVDLKDQLPSPIYDERPIWVRAYWKAWEL